MSPHGTKATAAGGANIGNNHITLELPNIKPNTWQLDFSMGILTHEIGHIFFRISKYKELIEKIIKKRGLPKTIKNIRPERPTTEVMEELIIESLVPYGYLGQKYYKFKPVPFLFSDLHLLGETYWKYLQKELVIARRWRKYFVWQLYPLLSYYFRENRKIDKNFIKIVIKIIS